VLAGYSPPTAAGRAPAAALTWREATEAAVAMVRTPLLHAVVAATVTDGIHRVSTMPGMRSHHKERDVHTQRGVGAHTHACTRRSIYADLD
jgi:hypothetical protein